MGDIPIIKESISVKQSARVEPSRACLYRGRRAYSLRQNQGIEKTTGKADKLHVAVTSQVNAAAQARSMEAIRPLLNEEEEGIFLKSAQQPSALRSKKRKYRGL